MKTMMITLLALLSVPGVTFAKTCVHGHTSVKRCVLGTSAATKGRSISQARRALPRATRLWRIQNCMPHCRSKTKNKYQRTTQQKIKGKKHWCTEIVVRLSCCPHKKTRSFTVSGTYRNMTLAGTDLTRQATNLARNGVNGQRGWCPQPKHLECTNCGRNIQSSCRWNGRAWVCTKTNTFKCTDTACRRRR